MRQEPAAISADQAHEYSESMGQIGAGLWRQLAWAERNRIPDALGMTMREWVERYVGNYVRLSVAERRAAVAELAAEGMSQRQIADVVGVSQPTVHRDLEDETNVSDGARERRPRGARTTADETNVSPAPGMNLTTEPEPVADQPVSDPDAEPEPTALIEEPSEEARASGEDEPARSPLSDTDAWQRAKAVNPEGWQRVQRATLRKAFNRVPKAIAETAAQASAAEYGAALEWEAVPRLTQQIAWLQAVIASAEENRPRVLSMIGKDEVDGEAGTEAAPTASRGQRPRMVPRTHRA